MVLAENIKQCASVRFGYFRIGLKLVGLVNSDVIVVKKGAAILPNEVEKELNKYTRFELRSHYYCNVSG